MYRFQQELNTSKYLVEKGVPYVVLNEKGAPRFSLTQGKGAFDILLSWPVAQTINGRKDFLLKKNNTKLTLINVKKADAGNLLQIKATDAGDEIPIDQFVVQPNIGEYATVLPVGRYIAQLVDSNGKVVWKKNISVE